MFLSAAERISWSAASVICWPWLSRIVLEVVPETKRSPVFGSSHALRTRCRGGNPRTLPGDDGRDARASHAAIVGGWGNSPQVYTRRRARPKPDPSALRGPLTAPGLVAGPGPESFR